MCESVDTMDFGKVRSLLLWCGSEGVQQFVANVTYTNYTILKLALLTKYGNSPRQIKLELKPMK